MDKYAIAVSILILFFISNNETEAQNQLYFGVTSTLDSPSDDIAPIMPLNVSYDHGKSWNGVAGLPANLSVRFIESMGEELIIATDNAGVFASSDDRTTWRQIASFLPSQKINALHIHENTIYVGCYQKGIFSTDSKGFVWKDLNFDITDLAIQAINVLADRVIVGSDSGVFTLMNGEKSWSHVFEKDQVNIFLEEDGKLLAGTSKGLISSFDKGDSWNTVQNEGAVFNLALLNGKIFIMESNNQLESSSDWGKTWDDLADFPKKGTFFSDIISHDDDTMIMSNGMGISISKDEGKTWDLIFKVSDISIGNLLYTGQVLYGAGQLFGC